MAWRMARPARRACWHRQHRQRMQSQSRRAAGSSMHHSRCVVHSWVAAVAASLPLRKRRRSPWTSAALRLLPHQLLLLAGALAMTLLLQLQLLLFRPRAAAPTQARWCLATRPLLLRTALGCRTHCMVLSSAQRTLRLLTSLRLSLQQEQQQQQQQDQSLGRRLPWHR